MDAAPMKPLVRCPSCASRLIYAEAHEPFAARVIVRRRCPECEHRDEIETTRFVAEVWQRRDARICRQLAAYADALGRGEALR
jgi:DNA-directed RNA polymerase subunit RPC12/RpoP